MVAFLFGKGIDMAKRGRPPKVNIEDLINDASEYIATADPPILAEYAHIHGITRQYLYELANSNKELSDTIKTISEAKEVVLERKGLSGEYTASMAIFSLKQLGWKDTAEVTDTKALDKLDSILGELKNNAETEPQTE